jgi:hypothetical protein
LRELAGQERALTTDRSGTLPLLRLHSCWVPRRPLGVVLSLSRGCSKGSRRRASMDSFLPANCGQSIFFYSTVSLTTGCHPSCMDIRPHSRKSSIECAVLCIDFAERSKSLTPLLRSQFATQTMISASL